MEAILSSLVTVAGSHDFMATSSSVGMLVVVRSLVGGKVLLPRKKEGLEEDVKSRSSRGAIISTAVVGVGILLSLPSPGFTLSVEGF
ncbi:Os08g0104501 [Oryza sativa Japonica Group]|uniref:Os08g0104501 protein n=1 Tax=Oryza sativa subsp. japonica TaxID=39947 RepID=A0A0P0XAQ7_ORYSJ|nr:Os08g0104501 [Oryza sativa Japonica Group]